ncbi:MAG: hypothetical protein II367_03885 [Treponema sp.]|nr:hypothetical protein [Treponema sp.]
MRKPVALILYYLTVTMLNLAVGIFFFTQYFNSITLVAGKSIDFSAEVIAYGLFESLPLVFILVPMFVTFYKIRHLGSPVSSCITYCALMLVTWFCFFPLTEVLQKNVYSMLTPIENLESKSDLSGGYFRNINGKLYYFVSDSKNNVADVFKLFDSARPNSYADRDFIQIGNLSRFSDSAGEFHDPIIKESSPEIPFKISEIAATLKSSARNAWDNGLIAWLCFCSLGFALTSLYSFVRISSWKLVNFYWVSFFTSIVLWFNYFYFQPEFSLVRKALFNLFHESGRLSFFLVRDISLPLTCINLIFALIMTSIGIINATSKRRGY